MRRHTQYFLLFLVLLTISSCFPDINPQEDSNFVATKNHIDSLYNRLDKSIGEGKCKLALRLIESISLIDSLNEVHEKRKVIKCYSEKGSLDTAINLIHGILPKVKNKVDDIELYLLLSKNFYELEEYDSALLATNKGLNLIKYNVSSASDIKEQEEFYKTRIRSILKLNKLNIPDIENYFSTRNIINSLKDSFQIANIERDKKDMAKRRTLIVIIMSFILAIILLSILFYLLLLYRKNKAKIKIEKSRMEGERKGKEMISSDLHDELGIDFLNMSHLLSQIETKDVEKIAMIQQLLDIASSSIRGFSKLVGSSVYITDYIDNFIKITNQANPNHIFTHQLDVDESKVNDIVFKANVLRFVKEVCNNVLKHANATRTNLILRLSTKQLYLKVTDDGIGLDKKIINEKIFLRTIKNRINRINPNINIEKVLITTNQDSGASIIIDLPLF